MDPQPTPFDPVEYLDIARDLVTLRQDEASLRAAIGRAYYALFLVAREQLGVTGNEFIHWQVVQEVKKHDDALGDKLDAVSRLRKVADYQLIPNRRDDRNWSANWSRVLAIAEDILPRLQTLGEL